MALVVKEKRIYGHDYTPKRGWHRHLPPNGKHNHSEEGRKPMTVEEFLKKGGRDRQRVLNYELMASSHGNFEDFGF